MSTEDPDIIPVTCGIATGYLHQKLFICPGIRVPCIEFGGNFVTPKDFTYIGNKHTLKDWKTAIRINGVSLRKMIDTGELCFYDHKERCTGRCASRCTTTPKVDIISTLEDAELSALDATAANLEEQAYSVLQQVETSDLPQEVLLSSVSPILNTANTSSAKSTNKLQKITSIGSAVTIKKEPQDTFLTQDATYSSVLNHSTPNRLHKITTVKKEPLDSPIEKLQTDSPKTKIRRIDLDTLKSKATKFTTSNGVKTFIISPADLAKIKSSSGAVTLSGNNSTLSITGASPRPSISASSNISFQSLHAPRVSKYDIGPTDSAFENLADSFPNVEDFINESQEFWMSIVKLGLMESVITDLQKTMDYFKKRWVAGNIIPHQEASNLSKAVSNLGLTGALRVKLAEHKTSMLRQNIKLQMEIKQLKNRLAESERKQEEHKRMNEAFETLIEIGNKAKQRVRKGSSEASNGQGDAPSQEVTKSKKQIKKLKQVNEEVPEVNLNHEEEDQDGNDDNEEVVLVNDDEEEDEEEGSVKEVVEEIEEVEEEVEEVEEVNDIASEQLPNVVSEQNTHEDDTQNNVDEEATSTEQVVVPRKRKKVARSNSGRKKTKRVEEDYSPSRDSDPGSD